MKKLCKRPMGKAIAFALAVMMALAAGWVLPPVGEAWAETRPAVGEIIEFGGRDWRVLDVQGDYALLLHETVIANQPYHHTWEDVTWATSSSRQWLNGEFFNSFSAADRARIRETYVVNNDNPWCFADFAYFGDWGLTNTPGGANTRDRIFLLSIDEVLRYFGDSEMVARGATMGANERDTGLIWPEWGIYIWGIMDQYSEARIAYNAEGLALGWWLRSPGGFSGSAAPVDDAGNVRVRGYSFGLITAARVGLRPALWLRLESTPAPTPAPEPIPPAAVADVRVGQMIQFGGYNWLVLDVQGGQALVITENIIEQRRYHHTREAVTWENSEIRQYLNGDFLSSFSPANQARIAETTVINNNNPWFGTNGGNDTTDRIFLLSVEEVVRFFGDSGQLHNGPNQNTWWITDQYNNARIARNDEGSASWWWLRSPGSIPYGAARVDTDGFLFMNGFYVCFSGGDVRPALWLNLESSPTATPAPTPELPPATPFVPPTTQITPLGRQAAEEFLLQFPSIFMGVPITGEWGLEEGQFSLGWDWANNRQIITYEVPDFYFRHDMESWQNSGFFDRHGNRITDAPWIFSDDGWYAGGFSLRDLDFDGIPEISIYPSVTFATGGSWFSEGTLYRFIDGEYRMVPFHGHQIFPWFAPGEDTNFRAEHYFLCNTGRLAAFINTDDYFAGSYAFISFTNGRIELEVIADGEENFAGNEPGWIWTNRITGAQFFKPPPCGTEPVTIPGTPDIILTPILPLTDLQESITASVTQRLMSGDTQPGEIHEPDTAESPYIHSPTPPQYTFAPPRLANVTDPSSAQSAIYSVITGLTPEQRTSGDALNTATLHIENLSRRGTTQTMPGDGSLDIAAFLMGAHTAGQLRQETNAALDGENLTLLRDLRTNINFMSRERRELRIAFPDDVSALDFDNVTVESEFVSVTINRGHIPVGGEFRINQVAPEDVPDLPGAAAGGIDGADRNVRTDAAITHGGGILDTLINFWSVIVVILLLVTWIILFHSGKKLRVWVIPTIAVTAIAANIGTFVLRNNNGAAPAHIEYTAGRPAETENITAAQSSNAVEVTMTEGMRATLSLPVNGQDPEFLVLVNENNEIQHSRFNPVTETIDGRIRTDGIYILRENAVSFADISNKSRLMQDAILQLSSRGIMRGAAGGYFHPDDPITRAELVATIVMAFDMLDLSAQTTFTDISPAEWHFHAIATAQQEGLISGFDDSTFRGGLEIPKDQMFVIAANSLVERMGYRIPADVESILAVFLDREQLAYWAEGGIALTTQTNVLIHRADGLFAPQSAMTRGDAAIVLYRLFSRIW